MYRAGQSCLPLTITPKQLLLRVTPKILKLNFTKWLEMGPQRNLNRLMLVLAANFVTGFDAFTYEIIVRVM